MYLSIWIISVAFVIINQLYCFVCLFRKQKWNGRFIFLMRWWHFLKGGFLFSWRVKFLFGIPRPFKPTEVAWQNLWKNPPFEPFFYATVTEQYHICIYYVWNAYIIFIKCSGDAEKWYNQLTTNHALLNNGTEIHE